MGSVHAHKYGFPFQQPSTSCGTYTTLSVKIVIYLIILRYLQNTILHILLFYQYIKYISILYRTIRKSSVMASCFRFCETLYRDIK